MRKKIRFAPHHLDSLSLFCYSMGYHICIFLTSLESRHAPYCPRDSCSQNFEKHISHNSKYKWRNNLVQTTWKRQYCYLLWLFSPTSELENRKKSILWGKQNLIPYDYVVIATILICALFSILNYLNTMYDDVVFLLAC